MTFLIALDPAIFPQVSHSHIKCVVHKFFKVPTIPEVESKQYARVNMCGIINALGVLQDNRLKNEHPLRVILPSLCPVELHR